MNIHGDSSASTVLPIVPIKGVVAEFVCRESGLLRGFAQFTPHQLSLSRLRKIVPEEHQLYCSPSTNISRNTNLQRRSVSSVTKPREHQRAA